MLDPNISRYIWTHTKRQQLWVLAVVAASMIPYFLSLNLPKQIVNGPIQGDGFADPTATQTFMQIAFDLPYFGNVTLFNGIELDRLNMLFALSGVFLLLVIVNGLFKYYINTYKGRLGERLLRRIRFTLVDHILRFPPATFKRLKGAEISSMVKDEVEPLGGFTGDAFVAPALLGGQAIMALAFIFVQSIPLGLITAALVAVQALVIPRMRRRLLVLGRERQLTARELAGRVSEIVDGINTIHSYDTSNFERADISSRLGRIYKIRFDIYQWKFMVKFINNFLASVTPFLFYSVGGYLALQGRLDIGQLVAVIGAYKDLPGPLKELIDWDQNRQDVQIKYSQVITQFAVDGLIEPEIQAVSAERADGKFAGPLAAINLGVMDDTGSVGLDRVNFSLTPGETVAIIGNAGSGADIMAEVLARIVWPTQGQIVIGDADLHSLPESLSGRTITYAGTDAYFFFGTVRDNLLYGLKHAPITDLVFEGADLTQRQWEKREAAWAGNPEFDINSSWIDFEHHGAADLAALMPSVYAALDAVSLTRDMFDFALRSNVNLAEHVELKAKTVEMRRVLRDALTQADLNGLIEPFEPGTYNVEATVIENLLFGNARTPELMAGAIISNPYFRTLLEKRGLADTLFAVGTEVARNAIELFSDLPPDHPFFQQLTFMKPDDIPLYSMILNKLDKSASNVSESDRAMMIRLSFDYIEPRHRFGLLSPELMTQIVDFRTAFHEGLPANLKDAIELYDPEQYMVSGTLLDNMLFGRISQKYRDAVERIYTVAGGVLRELGIYDTLLSIGLDFHVGAGGKRLTSVQRQKLALARALIRRSDFYLFNRPLSALDTRTQEKVLIASLKYLHKDGRKPAVAWVISNPKFALFFDRVAIFERGRVVEDGSHTELSQKNGIFKELMSA
ncbi:ABC transporter ATP-binding protein [Cypionkella sp.]|uniref:ABC transporter transmembrane domain-containing protein n=1 Tax=Cypionkella sp. TaxID=2811411 RepID=UPI00260EEBB7|nr:ABC transporter ATP-binding protein [Cypionkella sp.]MDB5666412.1 transporter ATP-binding protein [Cypionkella sp.]